MSDKKIFSNWLHKWFIITLIGLFLYITGISNVLWVFWQTIDNSFSTVNFMTSGSGYGYGYGYGYNNSWTPKCGTAFKTFDRDDTGWGSSTFCEVGYAIPSSPIFPTSDSTTTWQCKSGSETVSCSADKEGWSSSSGWWGGWWGGGSSSQDYCPDGDYTSSVYDGQCGTPPEGGDDDSDSNNNSWWWADTNYQDGLCKFKDISEEIQLLGIPSKYSSEVSYHTSRCTLFGITINGKRYLVPYKKILLNETIKVIARLNPEWFDNLEDFREWNYNPRFQGYINVLNKKWIINGVVAWDPDKKLNYYDFMTMLLNRLEAEWIITPEKNTEVMNTIPVSWKTKYTQRVKMLKILAFIDHNIKR